MKIQIYLRFHFIHFYGISGNNFGSVNGRVFTLGTKEAARSNRCQGDEEGICILFDEQGERLEDFVSSCDKHCPVMELKFKRNISLNEVYRINNFVHVACIGRWHSEIG